jgi:hypothetical protein
MKLPEINLKELAKAKEENFRERLEFQDRYVEWLKKTNNAKWSSEQRSIINKKSTRRKRK